VMKLCFELISENKNIRCIEDSTQLNVSTSLLVITEHNEYFYRLSCNFVHCANKRLNRTNVCRYITEYNQLLLQRRTIQSYAVACYTALNIFHFYTLSVMRSQYQLIHRLKYPSLCHNLGPVFRKRTVVWIWNGSLCNM
jgi:hypothetical protein